MDRLGAYKLDQTKIPERYGPWLKADVGDQKDRFLNAGGQVKEGIEKTQRRSQQMEPQDSINEGKVRDDPQVQEISFRSKQDNQELQKGIELVLSRIPVRRRLFGEEECEGAFKAKLEAFNQSFNVILSPENFLRRSFKMPTRSRWTRREVGGSNRHAFSFSGNGISSSIVEILLVENEKGKAKLTRQVLLDSESILEKSKSLIIG
uniref:Uncharacterized protein n=1 Tax=Nelumbo nucifera TaxID=4432 RepID=A0A822ZTS5_NELNU|nr:TPA_asm: hypothetical protein HUJ06_017887 [Nelumbo nucifera]